MQLHLCTVNVWVEAESSDKAGAQAEEVFKGLVALGLITAFHVEMEVVEPDNVLNISAE